MRPIYERCCGLDVHKKTVVACRITPEDTQTRTFGTMTDELVRLREWLLAAGVTHVAMESSGVYWKPVYNLLKTRAWSCWWSMPGMSKPFRDGRPTSRMPSGWLSCSSTGCSKPASFPTVRV